MKNNRYIPFLLSILILIVSIIAVSKHQPTESVQTASATYDEIKEEMKGIWVSYITLDMQSEDNNEQAFTEKINTIIDTTIDSGFNTLIFQVRPFCDALYKSSYYPYSHILTGTQGKDPGYDPLQIICELCHKNNINVHAWINPYRVKNEQTPSKLSNDNLYIIDNSIGFEQSGSIYLDPASEKAQQLIVNGVKEIVQNYDVDGIQFDDYFYPENSDSVDNQKYQEYKDSTENPLSKEMWRCENVNTLIKKVYDTVHRYSNNVQFGISPQGNLNNNRNLGADVELWCENSGYIDYICPQIYFSLDNPTLSFEESLSQWQNLSLHPDLSLYIGLAGYKGGTDEDNGTWLDNDDILKNEIEICSECGTDGIMLFSYESFFDETNSAEIKNVVRYMTDIKE